MFPRNDSHAAALSGPFRSGGIEAGFGKTGKSLLAIKLNPNTALILRNGLLAASRRIGRKRLWPSFETPRKRAAPQDED
jgi:hypothetical protein